MGLLNLFKNKKTPQNDLPIPRSVNTSDISEEKKKHDLEMLEAFNKKIGVKNATPEVKAVEEKREDQALKLKNPFRGI